MRPGLGGERNQQERESAGLGRKGVAETRAAGRGRGPLARPPAAVAQPGLPRDPAPLPIMDTPNKCRSHDLPRGPRVTPIFQMRKLRFRSQFQALHLQQVTGLGRAGWHDSGCSWRRPRGLHTGSHHPAGPGQQKPALRLTHRPPGPRQAKHREVRASDHPCQREGCGLWPTEVHLSV